METSLPFGTRHKNFKNITYGTLALLFDKDIKTNFEIPQAVFITHMLAMKNTFCT